jgi:hypothetical protein
MSTAISALPTAAAFNATDYVAAIIWNGSAFVTSKLPKSLVPIGATIVQTKLPLKGDNNSPGNALAQAIQNVGNVATATIAVGTDVVVFTAALTAPCVLTLPAISGMPPGHLIAIRDPGGFVSSTNTVSIARAGADTINGAAANVTVLAAPRGTALVTAGNALTDWGFQLPIGISLLPLKGLNNGLAGPITSFAVGNVTTATIPAGTNLVYFTTALTAPCVLTMPASAGYTIPDSIFFLDGTGAVGTVNTVSVVRAGSDLVNGVSTNVLILNGARSFAEICLGASGGWGLVGQTASAARSVVGVIDGSTAPAGSVGEPITSVIAVGSAVALTTLVAANVTSISLTAGEWDVYGVLDLHPAATTTISQVQGGPSATTGTLGTQDQFFTDTHAIPAGLADPAWVIPRVRVRVSATTTYFLVAKATFAVSTLSAYGSLIAIRAR